MNDHFDFRPLLAAAAVLLLLAGAYEAAVPGRRRARRPATQPAPAAQPAAAAPAPGPAPQLEPAPAPAPEPDEPERPECPEEPIRFRKPDPHHPPRGLHRYVGTVDGQPVTALLEWPTLLNGISGSVYRHRGGPVHALDWDEKSRRRPVFQLSAFGDDDPGEWHLTGWPGAELRGTWHDAMGRHPFALRESYAGGVQLAVHTLELVGGQSYHASPQSNGACEKGGFHYEYLQFPGPGAVAPALRQTIGQPPAAVRRRLLAAYSDAHQQRRDLVDFLLNDFGLLGYRLARSSTMAGDGGKGDYWLESYLYDLATGQELTVASQLQPGARRGLRRLAQHHLLHEPQFDFINREHRAAWRWQDSTSKDNELGVLFPGLYYDDHRHNDSPFLTGSGLEFKFSSYELYDDFEPGGREYTIVIPYRELRPLVRPGTPLARMLRARGLW